MTDAAQGRLQLRNFRTPPLGKDQPTFLYLLKPTLMGLANPHQPPQGVPHSWSRPMTIQSEGDIGTPTNQVLGALPEANVVGLLVAKVSRTGRAIEVHPLVSLAHE